MKEIVPRGSGHPRTLEAKEKKTSPRLRAEHLRRSHGFVHAYRHVHVCGCRKYIHTYVSIFMCMCMYIYIYMAVDQNPYYRRPPLLQTFVAGPLLQTLVADLCVEDCGLQGACRGGVCRRTPPSVTNLCREAAQTCYKANVFDSLPYIYIYIYMYLYTYMHTQLEVYMYVRSCM